MQGIEQPSLLWRCGFNVRLSHRRAEIEARGSCSFDSALPPLILVSAKKKCGSAAKIEIAR